MMDEITGRADESSSKAPEYRDRLVDLYGDFDLETAEGSDTLGAWFLGPLAENQELFGQLLNRALESHCKDRKSFYPGDPAYVTPEIKNSQEYKNSVEVLSEETEKLLNALRGSVPFFSYRYQSHMNWDVTLPAIVGYFAGMLYNPNNVAAEASPVTTLLEKAVGDDLCRMLGYDILAETTPRPWGHITCDGSVANIEALWSARNLKYYPIAVAAALEHEPALAKARNLTVTLADGVTSKRISRLTPWELLNLTVDDALALPSRIVEDYGVPVEALAAINEHSLQKLGYEKFAREHLGGDIGEPAVFAPITMHYSWPKAAALLGIGQHNLIPIEVDLDARAKASHLRSWLDTCETEQRPVLMAVAVLGNTEQSSVDPLAKMIAMRREYQRRNFSYVIHADAAWGGYFASIKRESAIPAAAGQIRFTPDLSMSPYVNEQYNALGETDSITIDPHKAGYIPYPAGGLCYRNKAQRNLVAFSPPYVAHDEEVDTSVGFYGVEGSKPGAAAAGVYLSHRVIAPDQRGYGRILGQTLFNSKRLYAQVVTMAQPDDPFIVVPCQRLPAEKKHPGDKVAIHNDLRYIRDEIIGATNEEIYAKLDDPKQRKFCVFFRDLGSDQVIIAYAFNFYADEKKTRLNTSIAKMNKLNSRVFATLSMAPADSITPPNGKPVPPMIVTGSTFDPRVYKDEYMGRLRARLGVEDDPSQSIDYIISTTMDPWVTDTAEGNFIPKVVEVLRQTVIDEVKRIWREDAIAAQP
ncbi:pyridoxal phosphate-dependent decarboxylase family protein [Actinokineospora iranica]|uniref:Pyridoxal-dependent decarboxylase conserved domain-containing protein n=1 Tax=Actinokineospora iranica TaxID=1271860 RepID=A0A1G6U0W6_9PSEU|nr:pyridoxal-dependent decarboxylase [Actinokineospora iranica]SDD34979.1 Pyridoxal-dependent decarboxylase conserved domain-containing protein [Actinokineospora iranica]